MIKRLKKLFGISKRISQDTLHSSLKEKNQVKILFSFQSDILDAWTVETMWADVVDEAKGLYKLDNIPFYVPLIASGDIVFAEYDETEERLTYRETIEYSGNSTVHVVRMNIEIEVNFIRNIFKAMGCASEGVNEGYFSMEIPANINYKPIKEKLDELDSREIIGYAESCLSDKHQY